MTSSALAISMMPRQLLTVTLLAVALLPAQQNLFTVPSGITQSGRRRVRAPGFGFGG